VEAKYGLTEEQIFVAYEQALSLGARRFGLHTMLISNELNYKYMVDTAEMILELAGEIGRRFDIRFEFVNLGGGIGIPYKPEQKPFDVAALAREINPMFADFENTAGYRPKLFLECGRYMTGPHGVLVCTAVNRKDIYRTYIGLDACMSSLMRPAMYGAYHHIDVLGKETGDTGETVDVVGALCENNDKFAIQRTLPKIEVGDIVVIQDTGAHGHAMGFNYNGRLRPKELLLRLDGNVELIRREETVADHFITLNFTPDVMTPERLRL
jgi:diaminopimelate decarboxylase